MYRKFIKSKRKTLVRPNVFLFVIPWLRYATPGKLCLYPNNARAVIPTEVNATK